MNLVVKFDLTKNYFFVVKPLLRLYLSSYYIEIRDFYLARNFVNGLRSNGNNWQI